MAINLNVNKVKAEEWAILDEKGQRAFNFTVLLVQALKLKVKQPSHP